MTSLRHVSPDETQYEPDPAMFFHPRILADTTMYNMAGGVIYRESLALSTTAGQLQMRLERWFSDEWFRGHVVESMGKRIFLFQQDTLFNP